ncbi:hypothetical protein IWW50_005784, partial [Coemansia erecta]
MSMDSETFSGTACSRVPAEILLEIFTFLTPYQRALHACVQTCWIWNYVATPVLWKRPQFSRLAGVERFAASLLTAHRFVAHGDRVVRISPYARLIDTLSFSSLPEHDRNNPHLATLLDSIVKCMTVVAAPELGSGMGAWSSGDGSPTALVLGQARSNNDDSATRPHSAAGLPMPDAGGDTATCVEAECGDRPTMAKTAGDRPAMAKTAGNKPAAAKAGGDKPAAKASGASGHELQSPQTTVDDTQLHYSACAMSQPMLAASKPSTSTPPPPQQLLLRPDAVSNTQPMVKPTLRQLDLRFCKGVRNYSLQRLAPKLATLTVLNLAGGLRTDITIAKLSQHMFQLRRISLAWTSNLTDFGVCELVQRCKSIECLDLTYCMQVEDTALFAIAHNLRGLTALSVAYCSGVHDIGVREVAISCPKLRVLNVAKCQWVTDPMRRSLEEQRI